LADALPVVSLLAKELQGFVIAVHETSMKSENLPLVVGLSVV